MEKRTVFVRFVDAKTGQVFASADMPPENLPQTFALDTAMSIKDEEWRVVKAEPVTAQDFVSLGQLTLTLSKIETVPIEKILYTLPSICDRVPPLVEGSTKRGVDVFEIAPDDWRQIECISQSYTEVITTELQQIDQVIRETGKNNGYFWSFRACHVRRQPDPPITARLTLPQLYALFPSTITHYAGVAYPDEDSLVAGGFAFRLGDMTVYGQQEAGFVRDLCIERGEDAPDPAFVSAIENLLRTYSLYLVAWLHLAAYSAGDVKEFFATTD